MVFGGQQTPEALWRDVSKLTELESICREERSDVHPRRASESSSRLFHP